MMEPDADIMNRQRPDMLWPGKMGAGELN